MGTTKHGWIKGYNRGKGVTLSMAGLMGYNWGKGVPPSMAGLRGITGVKE